MGDTLEKIEFKIPQSVAYTLMLEAHKQNMKFNDFMIKVASKAAQNVIDDANAAAQIVDLEAANG
jgi:uncharacterized protein (DUF1778 family)